MMPDGRPGWVVSACYVCVMRLRQGPLLVGGVGAGPDLDLGAGAAEAGVVEALAGIRVHKFAVGLVGPGLRAGAVAGIQEIGRAHV